MFGALWRYLRAQHMGLLALGFALGGTAAAATGSLSSSTVIRGCVGQNGTLTVASRGHSCPGGARSLRWNQAGRRGRTGAEGATGPQGPQGLQGQQGPPGQQGLQGNPGATGDPEVVARTAFTGFSGSMTTADASYHQIATIGSFTKQKAGTVVTLDWNGGVGSTGAAGTTYCLFQLRIDGHDSTGGTSPDDSASGIAELSAPSYLAGVDVRGIFSGLAAGSHTITLWALNGGTDGCNTSYSNYDTQVVNLEEGT